MKLFLFTLLIITACNFSYSQCTSDAFVDKCAEGLSDYTYVKLYEVATTKKENVVNYSVIFNKDHEYLLIICYDTKNTTKKMVVNLLDRNKKLIQSSYYEPKKLHVSKIAYKCAATGVYYLEASFEDNTESCGTVILGFKKL